MADIQIQRVDETQFRVEVHEGGSRTLHTVTVKLKDLERYGSGSPAETLIERSFEFLLEQEPKEAILRSFDLSLIETYFPHYSNTIRSRLT